MTKPLHRHVPEKSGGQDRVLKVLGIVAVALAAGIPFVLGKYFELNSPDPFDSAIYAYSARHILEGAQIGVDEIPSAQIGTLLVNILGVALGGFNETGPKLIQGLLQLGALVLMFVAMRRLFGTLAAGIGVVVASVYLSAPVIAKYGNVKEQHMIAFMVMGISCFILYQLADPKKGRPWIWAVLAGAFLSWAPLFKQTGMSAVAATGLYVLAQPVLRHRTLRQTGIDILLLLAGAALALGPLYIWIIGWGVKMPLPYDWVGFVFAKLLPAKAASADPNTVSGDYVSSSRRLVSLSSQAAWVFRYYGVLILPVGLALCSILLRVGRMAVRGRSRDAVVQRPYDRFVLLLAVWWLLDMAFVWVSPRPYEQYYLPLNASAAMLGGYCIAVYHDKVKAAVVHRPAWVVVGLVGAIAICVLAYPIFAGIWVSPATGIHYKDSQERPIRTRGYVQKVDEIGNRRTSGNVYPFEVVGDYIRQHSQPSDRIYVWGWIPGIYVRAQRFCPAPVACTSEMHVYPPTTLSKVVADLLTAFQKKPPRFIVDTHNRHFPYDPPRRPLELWPRFSEDHVLVLDTMPPDGKLTWAFLFKAFDIQPEDLTAERLLRADRPAAVERYEQAYARGLDKPKWPDEAARFKAMKPVRDYVMAHYRPAQVIGDQVIFELRARARPKEAP